MSVDERKPSGNDRVICHIPDGCMGLADSNEEFPTAKLVFENGTLKVEAIAQGGE